MPSIIDDRAEELHAGQMLGRYELLMPIATGGMGDTLSGVTGAFLALARDPRIAAGLGLWYCGRAAEIAGRGRGLMPRDVAEAIPSALLESPALSDIAGILLDLHPAY